MVTLNTEVRLEALEKVMEEQANRLTAIEAKLDKREAIQKSQFDLIRQQFAVLGSLLGQKELASIPAVEETTEVVYLPPPIIAPPPTTVTMPLVLSSPPSLTPPVIVTVPIIAPPPTTVAVPLVLSSPPSLTPPVIVTVHLAPYNHVVPLTQPPPPPPPPHLPFVLQQFSPLPAIQQQPTNFLPASYASQLPPPAATMSNLVCVYFVTPVLPHIMILLKELWLRLLRLAGMDAIFLKQIDVQHWKIWAVF